MGFTPVSAAWIDGDGKLHAISHRPGNVSWELYNLADGPAEKTNLAATERHPMQQMRTNLESWPTSVVHSLNGEDYPDDWMGRAELFLAMLCHPLWTAETSFERETLVSVQIRSVAVDELKAFHHATGVPFGFDPTPKTTERFANVIEPDRLRAVYDGDQIVATFGAFSLRLTVPGNTLPTAGTTVVTVLPTHRRRGILRSLMTEHLADVHRRNEPLAALWASESSIYGRFGYGPASERTVMKLDKSFARLQQPVSLGEGMRLVSRDEALSSFPRIYDRAAHSRPGTFQRSERWWQQRVLSDPEHMRHGATAHRRVLHVRDGQPVGYVLYRTRTDHAAGTTDVRLIELIGTDPEAEKALWQYVFGIDLVASIHHWNQPADDPLRWWLEQPRRMERKIEDALWVRLVDVAAALNGRLYASAGSVVLRMRDPLCRWNDGVFRLDVDRDGTGHCQPAAAEPEIELSPESLGAAYLGGHRLRDLARAGRVTGTPEALRRADALFTWDPLPWCQEIF